MIYYFTEEDAPTRERGIDVRALLAHAHHRVVHGDLETSPPRGTDVWFHGLGVDGLPAIDPRVVRALLGSRADIVLFQLCDAESMSFSRIPEELSARTRLFLRNHWPRDEQRIPERFRSRIGFLPPMLKAMKPRAGRPLAERSVGAIFFGTKTGVKNTPGGVNSREETVRCMRASGLPFKGGLVANALYATSDELVVPRIKGSEHARLLSDSEICLAPWGNHPITYRFFEGLANRCLVLGQSLRSTSFLDADLEPGRHYAEVAPDLSDLTEVARYYLNHTDEAQRIADAGHAHFRRFLAPRGALMSAWMFDATVASWGDLYRPSARRDVGTTVRSLGARLFPSRF